MNFPIAYNLIGFGEGRRTWREPFFAVGAGYGFQSTLRSVISNAEMVSIYDFMANDPNSHAETMYSINYEPGMFAFFVGNNSWEKYSFIILSYTYNNLYNNERGEFNTRNIGAARELGQLAADDIFIPIIEYIRENSNLYMISNIRQRMSSRSSFQREIRIYLNNPLDPEENRNIRRLWLEHAGQMPYNPAYQYIEITQYPIRIISEQPLSEADIAWLEQTYNLEYIRSSD